MSDNIFATLYVKAPAGNGYVTPQAMNRVNDHLTQDFQAKMKCSLTSGRPVQESDGTWEVSVFKFTMVNTVKQVLTQRYGLEIVREVPGDGGDETEGWSKDASTI